MTEINYQEIPIDVLEFLPKGQIFKKVIETIETVQENVNALINNDDSDKAKITKIGTVFTIFFLGALASGKKAKDFTNDDWRHIAENVSKYAIKSSNEKYAEFVFMGYAHYINAAADGLEKVCGEKVKESFLEIRNISNEIINKSELFNNQGIKEVDYIDSCLWLSLEALIKLLAVFISNIIAGIGAEEKADSTMLLSQLAFEYGRYIMYEKEQAILTEYINNQHLLDDELKAKYDEYIKEIKTHSERFKNLIAHAFDDKLEGLLTNSIELAREIGVQEQKLLMTTEDIDSFFTN